jgi:hypothetical protein
MDENKVKEFAIKHMLLLEQIKENNSTCSYCKRRMRNCKCSTVHPRGGNKTGRFLDHNEDGFAAYGRKLLEE